jgi:hypothetical protein
MLEAGVPFATVASLMGWSTATMVRMVKRYGHIGNKTRREAVNVLGGKSEAAYSGYYKNHTKSGEAESAAVQQA